MSSATQQQPHVRVDRDVCIGAGLCLLAAPEVFDQGDDGLVLLLGTEPPDPTDPAVREAVRCCPSGALTMQDVQD